MRRLIIACSTVMLLNSCVNLQDFEVVDGVRIKDVQNGIKLAQAMIPISDENELILGRGVAERVVARFGLEDNPRMTSYINLLGTALAQRSARPNIAYHFAILDTDEINAYACPGGFIFITRGLINTVRDEAELGAVLAHEIAHVTERHIVKAVQRADMMKAGAKLAEDALNNGGPLFDKMLDTATASLFEGLQKDDEFDADGLAVTSLNRLGYDYPAMFDVLNLLKQKRASSLMQVLNKTHPSPTKRFQQLQKSVRDMSLESATGVRLKARFEHHKSLNKS